MSEDDPAYAGMKLFSRGMFVISCYVTAMSLSLFGWVGPAVVVVTVGLATSALTVIQLLLL